MSINRAVITGRLTRDPELRTTTTGKQVAGFSVAVDDPYNKEHTNFFNCTAWGQTAEFVSKYLSKGRLVAVDGRLQQRRYTTNEGEERNTVEIVADRVQGLDKPKDDAGGGGSRKEQSSDEPEYDPFSE